jgi:hypothetical protein
MRKRKPDYPPSAYDFGFKVRIVQKVQTNSS